MASAQPQGGAGLLAEDLRDAWPALDAEERLEGFRLLDFEDDHEVLASEWIVYDALYAYCRARTTD